MSISDTVSQAACHSYSGAAAVASAGTKSAILAGLQAGDPQAAALSARSSAQAVHCQSTAGKPDTTRSEC